MNLKINHFAFTYGNYESIGEESLKKAFKKFDYIYSSLRGNNFSNFKKILLKGMPFILIIQINLPQFFYQAL